MQFFIAFNPFFNKHLIFNCEKKVSLLTFNGFSIGVGWLNFT